LWRSFPSFGKRPPPIKSLEQLESFEAWQVQISRVLEAESLDDIKEVKVKCNAIRVPLLELLSQGCKVKADIDKAIRARDTWKASQKPAPKRRKLTQGETVKLFEVAERFAIVPEPIQEGTISVKNSVHIDTLRSPVLSSPIQIACWDDSQRCDNDLDQVSGCLIVIWRAVFVARCCFTIVGRSKAL